MSKTHTAAALTVACLALLLAWSPTGWSADQWVTWLDCTFDDWPLTQPGEAQTFETGDRESMRGYWKLIGPAPYPRVTGDPTGRPGRSVMLTRYIGVPPLIVDRRPKIERGRVEIAWSVCFGEHMECSTYFAAVDPGNGKRDAVCLIRFGTGLVRIQQKGEWKDTGTRIGGKGWTRLRVLLDLDQREWSLFAGGKPAAAGLPLSPHYRPTMLQFGCAEASGSMWIDDVRVRTTHPPSAVEPAAESPRMDRVDAGQAETALPGIFDDANAKFATPSLAELGAGLARWAEARPGQMSLEIVGQSRGGKPIYLCRVTDAAAAAEHKQRVLVTASRGPERNATVMALALAKWLMSDKPAAQQTRRRQEVYVMPCCDPDGYADQKASERFAERLTWSSVSDPGRHPAGAALVRVIDRVQPEVHVDVRSTDDTRNVVLSESFGVDFDSATARAHEPKIPWLMSLAAERAGFSCLSGETGDGKIRATAAVHPLADGHYYQRRHRIVVPSLSYYRCHALSFTVHVAFQESFLAGMKELFAIGNSDRPWRMERHPGYPVSHMNLVLTGGFGAWGQTAAERRRSRGELWSKMEQITLAEPSYGIIGGRALVFCSDPAQMKRLMREGIHLPNGAHLLPWDKFAQGLRRERDAARFDVDAMDRMVRARHRPSVGMYYVRGQGAREPTGTRVRHGLALQLYLPFPSAKVAEIRLDGHAIAESPTDGYVTYHNPGTAVEVSIPPGRVQSLHVVTLLYEPGLSKREGFSRDDWQLE